MLAVKMSAENSFSPVTPDDIRDMKRFIDEHRSEKTPFDIVIEGITPAASPGQAAEVVRPFAEAGATWWIESMWDVPGGLDVVRRRIRQGPPRVD
jgi:hypothetical protein